MPWAVAGAAVAAGGSILGASIGSSAAGNAAKAQQKEEALSIDNQQANLTSQEAEQAPWINNGAAAVNQLGYLLGITPTNSDPLGSIPSNVLTAMQQVGSKANSPDGYEQNPSYIENEVQGWANMSPDDFAAAESKYGINVPQSDFQSAAAGLNGSTNGTTNGTSGGTATGATNAAQTYLAGLTPTGNGTYTDSSGNAVSAAQYQAAQAAAQGGATANNGGYGSLAQSFTAADFANNMDPAYGFDLQQGQEALQRTQAANGQLNSGAAAEAMDNYTQGLASNEYGAAYSRYNTNQNNLYNRLAGIAGTGQVSTGQVGTTANNTANATSTALTNSGTAAAQGILGGSTATQNALGNIFGSNSSNSGYYGSTGLGNAIQTAGNNLFGGSSNSGTQVYNSASNVGPFLPSAGTTNVGTFFQDAS